MLKIIMGRVGVKSLSFGGSRNRLEGSKDTCRVA
jgi:hypothetical protein